MKMFLTSTTNSWDGNGGLLEKNGFRSRLQDACSKARTGLFVVSDPEDKSGMSHYRDEVWASFRESGINLASFDILDGETKGMASRLIKKADVIYLSGGHVPTQNAFFNSFPLAMLLSKFRGVLVSASAGTMNAAFSVYAQPEEEGEAIDPTYKRFLKGLGLTKVSVLPHYQSTKDDVLDGKKLYEEITYPDSYGRTFFAFPDGTYILKDEEGERIYGECWTIHDGKMMKIAEDGDEVWVEKE